MIDVVLGEQPVETVIHVRFFCDLLFQRKRLGGRGRRIDVRHLEYGRDPAHRSCGGAGLPILLVRVAGLAEMHMDVYRSWQEMKTGGVERFPRARHRTLLADRQYLAVFDRDRGIE